MTTTVCCIAIFHNYCCYTKRGGITTNLTPAAKSLMCQNTIMRVYGARIKRYCVLCSKTYSSSSSVVITSHWFATSRQGAPASVRLVYSIWRIIVNRPSMLSTQLVLLCKPCKPGPIICCRLHIYPGKAEIFSFITVQFNVVPKWSITLRPDGRIRLFALNTASYHHYADVYEGIELFKYLSGTFCRVCV